MQAGSGDYRTIAVRFLALSTTDARRSIGCQRPYRGRFAQILGQRIDVDGPTDSLDAFAQHSKAVATVGEKVVDGHAIGSIELNRTTIEAHRISNDPLAVRAVCPPGIRETVRRLQEARSLGLGRAPLLFEHLLQLIAGQRQCHERVAERLRRERIGVGHDAVDARGAQVGTQAARIGKCELRTLSARDCELRVGDKAAQRTITAG